MLADWPRRRMNPRLIQQELLRQGAYLSPATVLAAGTATKAAE